MGRLGRVLVVDDNHELRAVTHDFLTLEGYEVRCAETAVGALTAVRACPPDVVLLDLMMPGAVAGDAVVRAISTQCAVIVVTGMLDEPVARRTLRDGAFDFVMKPVPLRRLKEIIEAAMLYQFDGRSMNTTGPTVPHA